PLLFVLEPDCTPVASLMTTTSAPLMTPPEGSRTIPLMVLSGDCAEVEMLNRRTAMKKRPNSLTLTRHLLGGNCLHSLLQYSRESSDLYQRVFIEVLPATQEGASRLCPMDGSGEFSGKQKGGASHWVCDRHRLAL